MIIQPSGDEAAIPCLASTDCIAWDGRSVFLLELEKCPLFCHSTGLIRMEGRLLGYMAAGTTEWSFDAASEHTNVREDGREKGVRVAGSICSGTTPSTASRLRSSGWVASAANRS